MLFSFCTISGARGKLSYGRFFFLGFANSSGMCSESDSNATEFLSLDLPTHYSICGVGEDEELSEDCKTD